MFITRIFPPRPVVWLLALFVLPLLALLLTLSAGTGAVAAPISQSPIPITRPILLTDPVPDPQQEGVLYFTPTGHTLRGSFLLYWQEHGGLAQFGYPLTEEFTEPLGPIVGGYNSPIMVQYFERNRFEHHPENQPPSDVLLGTLGREFLPEDAPTAKADRLPAPALYFAETGHNLLGQFKGYWQEHGGLAIHGYPLTEQFEERSSTDGKAYLVQYFERSRFEEHPENAGSPYEVLLGQLGRQLSEKRGYPYGWYPLYGHAADYTWLAGFDVPDIRLGFNTGCEIVKYSAIGAALSVEVGTSVRPVYPWMRSHALGLVVDFTKPIVVFGVKEEDPLKETQGFTCYAPKYKVRMVQLNPSHFLLTFTASTGALAASTAQSPIFEPTPATPITRPILLTDPVPDPQQEGVLYFPTTGRTLRGSFLLYWQQHGGLAQFGYPLTEEFTEPIGTESAPMMVQYFERNRFEHHPENQPPSDVLLGTLGREFLPEGAPTAKTDRLPSPALYFPETGHSLSGTFQEYWQEHGGLAIHGYPLTEPFEGRSATDGKVHKVQYFERSRFEEHPENAGSPYEMLLGQLGRQLSEKRGYPYGGYPQFGRAADFSWIAGQFSYYTRDSCYPTSVVSCGCRLFNYDVKGAHVQVGSGPGKLLDKLQTPARNGQEIFLVIFGRLAQSYESYTSCILDQNAPGYIYSYAIANPSP